MTPLNFTLVGNEDGGSNLTLVVKGRGALTAHSTHVNFQSILEGCLSGDESVADLFDIAEVVSNRFERVTERVTVRNGRVYFDGDEIDDVLTAQILRLLEEEKSTNSDEAQYLALARFFEKVQQNPQEHSKVQLFSWLDKHDFTITMDGDIVGYKGVHKVEDEDGNVTYESVSHGRAIVNGEEFEGAIPNNLGDIVEMPRSEVAHNPKVGCSVGLHVGTHSYANSFKPYDGALLEIHVNPRDVVSVPTESNWQKVRTCRYTVVGIIEDEYTKAVKPTVQQESDSKEWGDGEHDTDATNVFSTCENCGSDIDEEEYNRTGTDEYCESCPDLPTDPRSMAFGNFEEDDEDELDDEDTPLIGGGYPLDLPEQDDVGVAVGDVFYSTDSRRQGTGFLVQSVSQGYATGLSHGKDDRKRSRTISVERLLSRKYRKDNSR